MSNFPGTNLIRPAHGEDNYFRPDAPDLDRKAILPPLPAPDLAQTDAAWRGWKEWQLVVYLLPERDTLNGEYFDLEDIAPCLGEIVAKALYIHVRNLFPRWCGRYRFNLAHVIKVVKRYQLDGRRNYSRAQLIARAKAHRAAHAAN